MGRYLDGWEDAQSRGSSRNGGRAGESTMTEYFISFLSLFSVLIQALVKSYIQHLREVHSERTKNGPYGL